MVEQIERRRSRPWPVVTMLALTAAAWIPLYLQRRRAHQPNVDDYLYALQSMHLAHAGSFTGFVHDLLHTGQTAPLVLLLAAPGAVHGVDGAVAVELPLLLLLAAGAWFLARLWVGSWQAALIGAAAAANQAVLGWSLMVHFSVAASALCLWSLAAYLRSDGFTHRGWSLVTGLAVGLLLLSRSLAPAYVAPFVLVVAVDVIRRRKLPWVHAGLAALIAVGFAAPWWIASGGTALHYLRNAGYEQSSGFTRSGAHLSVESMVDRIRWTLGDLGMLQALILVAAPLTAVIHRRRLPGAGVVVGWLGLTLIVLATSSNVGTGFGLPLVSVAIVLGGVLVFARAPSVATAAAGQRRWRRSVLVTAGVLVVALLTLLLVVPAIARNDGGDLTWPLAALAVLLLGATLTFRSVAAVLVVAVLAVGFAAEWSGGTSQSWLGPPYRRMAIQAANGARAPNIDAVHREIARAIAGRPTLLVRDDDLLNGNGLRYTATTEHLAVSLVSAPFGDARGGVRKLADAQLLIAGTSPAPYHDYAKTVEAAAADDGWTKIRSWSAACGNTIDLWRKGGAPVAATSRGRTGSPYERAVLADAPVAYWRLGDRTCSAADASRYGNDAADLGNPGLGAASLIAGRNAAVHFDGKDDQIDFPNSPSLESAKAISMEAWVRADDLPSSPYGAWQLVSKWNTAVLYVRGGRKPRLAFGLYDPTTSSYKPVLIATNVIRPERTYHVVGTYDGSRMRLYVNGSPAGTIRHRGRLNQAPYGGVLAAAGWGPLPTPHFHGTLDEVAIYDHALSRARVETHDRLGIGSRGSGDRRAAA